MMFSLKLASISLIVAIAWASLVLSNPTVNSKSLETINQVTGNSARSRFVLPKLFNFEKYQKFFNKHYKSITEKLMRSKLFLARAFRAFVSAISYKHRRSSMYMRINHMSDWTKTEFKQIIMDTNFAERKNSLRVEHAKQKLKLADDAETPIASLAAINDVLKDVVDRKESDPVLAEIAEELEVGPDLVSVKESIATTNILDDHDRILAKPIAEKQNQESTDSHESKSFLFSVINSFSEPEANPVRLPDIMYVDHRDCLPPAEDQLNCNSCYIFSAMSLYEWAHCKTTNTTVYFSKQYAIDCGNRERHMKGCKSGSPFHVREFVLFNGLHYESEYPYESKETQCLYDESVPTELRGTVRIYDEGWDVARLKTIDEDLKLAPIVICYKIDKVRGAELGEYGGGVDDTIDCNDPNMTFNWAHTMVLVGSGREDDQEYYILRNTWGTDWGENGYYKTAKKSNCIADREGLKIKFPLSTPIVVDISPATESMEEKAKRNKMMRILMSVDSLTANIPN